MSNPEQAHEPTMEEILASIRRIISDDAQEPDGQEAEVAAEAMDDLTAEVQEPEPAPEADDDVLELTEEMSTEEAEELIAAEAGETLDDADDGQELEFHDKAAEEPEAQAEEEPDDNVEPEEYSEPEPERQPAMSLQPEALASAVSSVKPGLLSARTDASVASAFSSLENFVLSTHSRTLEDLVSEMLKPMLKGWLDVNLPPLVERMVREEIERVTRGRR